MKMMRIIYFMEIMPMKTNNRVSRVFAAEGMSQSMSNIATRKVKVRLEA